MLTTPRTPPKTDGAGMGSLNKENIIPTVRPTAIDLSISAIII